MIALTPKDEEERRLFSEFRDADVKQMLIYFCSLGSVYSVVVLAIFISLQTWDLFLLLMITVVATASIWIVWIIAQNQENNISRVLIATYIVVQLMFAIAEWLSDELAVSLLYYVLAGSIVFTLLFAPTLSFVLICYLPVSVINLIWIVFRHFETDEIAINLLRCIGSVLIAVVFWYILQKRELARFFQ